MLVNYVSLMTLSLLKIKPIIIIIIIIKNDNPCFFKACLRICIEDFNSYLKFSIIMTLLILLHFTLLFFRIFESVKWMEKSHLVVPEFPVTSSVKDLVKVSSWAKLWQRKKVNRTLKYSSSLRDSILNIHKHSLLVP